LHGSNPEPLMSASGQNQTFLWVAAMSALPPKADAKADGRRVRFVPEADMFTISLDQLVGTQLNLTRNREADRLCSLEVDHQLVLGGRLHGQVARLFSLQDAIDI
jgi:hypothetical protein